MPDRERDAERASGVARCRLDPDVFERHLLQHSSIRHAVQRNATSQTEMLHPGFTMNVTRHLQYHLFRDHLDAPREVHLALRDLRLGLPRWATEEFVKRAVRHPQSL